MTCLVAGLPFNAKPLRYSGAAFVAKIRENWPAFANARVEVGANGTGQRDSKQIGPTIPESKEGGCDVF